MSLQPQTPRTAAEAAKRIVEARTGSRDALGKLLNAYRGYLLRVANQELARTIRTKVDPSDLVQDTFLEAVRDFPSFQGSSEEELLGWLRRILCNNMASYYRRFETDKRQTLREIALEKAAADDLLRDAVEPSESPSGQAEAHDQRKHLERLMRRLPNRHRQVLHLHTAEELTFVQIAQKMDSTADAVRKLCGRAVEKLKKLVNAPS